MSKIEDYIKNHKDIIEKDKITPGGHFDKVILEYVSDIENGFFVEAGANIAQNTRILYDCGWTGLLIEPSRSSYEWCVENMNNCINENCALVSHDYKEKTIVGSQNTDINKTIHLFGYPHMNIDGVGEIKVSTFSDLTLKHNIKNIDVFFLDTEGYEMEVLKGVDFDVCYIKYFVIEVNNDQYTFEELKYFMENKNFELICNLSNFTKEDCPNWPGTHQDYLFKNKNQI